MSFFVRCFLFALVAMLVMFVPATAATEFCAATVSTFVPIHNTQTAKDLGTDTEFGFKLRAETGRTINATLAVYAGGDLYELPMQHVVLSPHTQTSKLYPGSSSGILMRTVFESEPLYLSLAAPMTVDAAWLSEAAREAIGKTCPTLPYTPGADPLRAKTTSDVPDATVRAMVIAKPMRMRLAAHVDAGSCATKFVPAKPLGLTVPDYPEVARELYLGHVIVVVTIALDSAGKVVDAWLIGSSGNPEIDSATVRAAKTSKFAPAQFLCVPIPGMYQFRANFDPAQ